MPTDDLVRLCFLLAAMSGLTSTVPTRGPGCFLSPSKGLPPTFTIWKLSKEIKKIHLIYYLHQDEGEYKIPNKALECFEENDVEESNVPIIFLSTIYHSIQTPSMDCKVLQDGSQQNFKVLVGFVRTTGRCSRLESYYCPYSYPSP